MKTWKDLKVGDTIWYYDKWKMHPQVVTKIEPKEEVDTYYDWNHVKHENARHWLIIHAGKGTKMSLYQYTLPKETTYSGGMPRFASKEAANKFLDERRRTRKSRIDMLQRQLDYLQNLLSKYPENIE